MDSQTDKGQQGIKGVMHNLNKLVDSQKGKFFIFTTFFILFSLCVSCKCIEGTQWAVIIVLIVLLLIVVVLIFYT
jgi:hypothetical protein